MNTDEIKVIILLKCLKENNTDTYEKVKKYLKNKYYEFQKE